MFEMEDVLDEWEALNLVEEGGSNDVASSSNPWEKVRSLLLSLCSCLENVKDRREVILHMKALSQRLDNILEEKGKYSFVQGESIHNLSEELSRVESTGVIDSPWVYKGREADQESLVKLLVSEDGEQSNNELQIISIVGIGGVGKTTLAQLAYNHSTIEAQFKSRVWVSVSQPFDPNKIAKTILEGLDTDNDKRESNKPSTDLSAIVERIKQIVSQKKFLVVLDDVWTEDRSKWEPLKNCLMHGAKGSRILLTTRNEAVARMMGTTHWQSLGLLSDEDCGTILNGIALKGRSEDECKKLSGIGLDIAKKCDGLPLAAKNVGSMLALKFTEQEWRDVLESPLWKYEDEVSDLFRLLKLSYLDLDPTLRRCFLSCTLYSKGVYNRLDEQTQKWLGYGYISSRISEDEVQLTGLQYFKKLAMRSFVEKLEDDDDGVIQFKVHDIMYDFASYISKNEQINCLVVDSAIPTSDLERLRCFSATGIPSEKLPPNLISLLKCIRVLIVLDCGLEELSVEVGKLIHLRYLDVSYNPLKELPNTITDLHNLQTLDVQECEELLRLPQGMEKMKKLRHLITKETKNLKGFPEGLKKITGLCTLTNFTAGKEGSKLEWLENLNNLRGFLRINIYANDEKDAEKANLKNKDHIRQLEFYFDEGVRMEVMLEALQPPHGLETLDITGYEGKRFPSWLMEPSFNNMKQLYIDGFHDCDLPPFTKLQCLEKLYMCDINFKRLTHEFLGIHSSDIGFPKLKTLIFKDCGSWEEWEDIGDEQMSEISVSAIFPCLKELELHSCNSLQGLPVNLLHSAKSLESLEIWKCERLQLLYAPESGTDWVKVSHISHVAVYEKEDEEEDEEEDGEEEDEDEDGDEDKEEED